MENRLQIVECPLWWPNLFKFSVEFRVRQRAEVLLQVAVLPTTNNNWLNRNVCNAQIRFNCTGINGKWPISDHQLLQITTLTLPLLHSACCSSAACRPRFTSLLTSPMWIWSIFSTSRILTHRIHALRRRLIRYWSTFRKRKPYWIMWSVYFWATLRSSSPAKYPSIHISDAPGDQHTKKSLDIVASVWSRRSARATPYGNCDTLGPYPTNTVRATIPVESNEIRLELYL